MTSNNNGTTLKSLPKVLILLLCKDKLMKTDGGMTFRREFVDLP